eukprot:CAMPEP_0205812844 /NCGR_PEP_ID=MMETSP0205-20121125/17465_1 /ASSEMBLY_ACC=CAM_ASM_000278 /TAXON_ID=36767 /ORGANISM="Euplotes focardii, Strain TN1" /LENGTH=122 /DNA_ID=CAMNT_0053094263 /DNA_START=122 /DNA_END=486 /DNA_ORIENTATION=-
MGSVGSPPSLGSSLDNNVGDHASLGIESLGLSVGLEVLEERVHLLHGLLGPSSEHALEFLGLGVSSRSLKMSPEGNDLFVLKDVLVVPDGFLDAHALHGLSGFVSVLVVSSEVVNLSLGRLG